MTGQQGLVVSDLWQEFKTEQGKLEILKGLNLAIAAGEFVSLLGASGAGKTSLLRIIAGLDRPRSGRVTFAGKELDPGQVGYLFQKPVLYPHLTVKENIIFGSKLRGFRGKLDQDHYRRLLSLLDIKDLQDRRPAQLSGGQAQRVGLARALVRRAALLLFDEPLSSVDEELSASIRADIKDLHRQLGFTALYITHNQNEAFELGQRVAVLDAGRIAQLASPQQLLKEPASLAVAQLTSYPSLNQVRVASSRILALKPQALSDRKEAGKNRVPVRLLTSYTTLTGYVCWVQTCQTVTWQTKSGLVLALPAETRLVWLSPEAPRVEAGAELDLYASAQQSLLFTG